MAPIRNTPQNVCCEMGLPGLQHAELELVETAELTWGVYKAIKIYSFKVWIESRFGCFLTVTLSDLHDFVSVSLCVK